MAYESYLTFELGQSRYGVPAVAVQEIFLLPEITPLAQAPQHIIGIVNLRGHILPVMDLRHRLQLDLQPYEITDSIIVLQVPQGSLCLLVNQVCEVISVVPQQVQARLQAQSWSAQLEPILAGIVEIEGILTTLIDPERLIEVVDRSTAGGLSATLQNRAPLLQEIVAEVRSKDLFDHLPSEQREILRDRAKNLSQNLDDQESSEQIPLAVTQLEGEYFGLGLESVYEFTNVSKVTPVPCCPPHIVGNINLRGEVITLLDIRDSINLPAVRNLAPEKAVIVRQGQLVAGIVVDEIAEVIYVHPTTIKPAPLAVNALNEEFLQGVTNYQNSVISIINLPKLLSSDELIVNQET